MGNRVSRRSLLAGSAVLGVAFTQGQSRRVAARQTAPAAIPVPMQWYTGVPIPEARSEMAAAVIDGQIYVPGGFWDGNRVDRYDPTSQTWTQLADLPVEVHHPGVAALDGMLYVAGGYLNTGHSAVRVLWLYDPGSDSWTNQRPLPEAKGALGLVAVDGALYAVGGAFTELGGPASGDLLRYDPAANEWETLEPMPTPREHLAVVAIDGRIHAIGGRANGDEGDAFGGAHEVYDIAAGTWSTAAPLPVPRSGLSGSAVDGTIVVLGGERGDKTFDDANRYDPATGAWDALPPMPTARHGIASAYVDGLLYTISGSIEAGGIDNLPVVEILPFPQEATPTA